MAKLNKEISDLVVRAWTMAVATVFTLSTCWPIVSYVKSIRPFSDSYGYDRNLGICVGSEDSCSRNPVCFYNLESESLYVKN